MRVLIDESLPLEVARALASFDVDTVHDRGWTGLRNGILLRAAIKAGLQIIVTADTSIATQQNIGRLDIAVVAIAGVRCRFPDLLPLIPDIVMAIRLARRGDVLLVRPRRPDRIGDHASSRLEWPDQLASQA